MIFASSNRPRNNLQTTTTQHHRDVNSGVFCFYKRQPMNSKVYQSSVCQNEFFKHSKA